MADRTVYTAPAEVEFPKGFEGPPERKWIKLKEGAAPDYALLGSLLAQASQSL